MRYIFLVITLFLFFSSNKILAVDSIQVFKNKTEDLPSTQTPHSYCYILENEKLNIEGVNANRLVRQASVSKLYTSYWGISAMGPAFRFTTRLYYNPGEQSLHIEGSLDPVFGRRSMQYILSQLNQKGVRSIRKVTFDEYFRFFKDVENADYYHTEITVKGGLTKAMVKEDLELFLNTKRWSEFGFEAYNRTFNTAKALGVEMVEKPEMAVEEIAFLAREKFQKSGEAIVWEFQSAPLYKYLKKMNVHSMNYVSDIMFEYLGGKERFAKFIEEDLGFTSKEVRIRTGSGLGIENPDRIDNYATCEATVNIILAMKNKIKTHGKYDLSDVMLVAGVEGGTLGSGFNKDELKQGVVAKTGTLNTAVTLAGYASTVSGNVYFGLFLMVPKYSLRAKARLVRNEIIEALMEQYGGKVNIDYVDYMFTPFDSKSSLREVTASQMMFERQFVSPNAWKLILK